MSKSSLAKEAGQSGIARKTLEAVPYDRANAVPITRVAQEVVKAGFHHPDLKVLQGCLASLRKDHLIGLAKGEQNIALYYRHRTRWASDKPNNNGHAAEAPKRSLVEIGDVYRRHGLTVRPHFDPVVVTDELRVQPVPSQEAPQPPQAPPAPPAAQPAEEPAEASLVRLNPAVTAAGFDLIGKLDQLLNLHMEAAALADELKHYAQTMPAEQQLAQIRSFLGCKP